MERRAHFRLRIAPFAVLLVFLGLASICSLPSAAKAANFSCSTDLEFCEGHGSMMYCMHGQCWGHCRGTPEGFSACHIGPAPGICGVQCYNECVRTSRVSRGSWPSRSPRRSDPPLVKGHRRRLRPMRSQLPRRIRLPVRLPEAGLHPTGSFVLGSHLREECQVRQGQMRLQTRLHVQDQQWTQLSHRSLLRRVVRGAFELCCRQMQVPQGIRVCEPAQRWQKLHG